MYKLLGNSVIDTDELKDSIEKNTKLTVREDLSSATKREDAVGFRLEIDIRNLGYDKNMKFEDEIIIDELMKKSDEYAKSQLKSVIDGFADYLDFEVYSYSFDEVSSSSIVVLAIMNRDNAYRKLRDVIKRLLTV
ncbi:MAG: hypothetical protein WBH44_04725 [Proteocatella sp.]